MSDTIADLLTRIRNAQRADKASVQTDQNIGLLSWMFQPQKLNCRRVKRNL